MTRATIAILAQTPVHKWQQRHHDDGKDACNNKCAYHGAGSAAELPGRMRNRFPCVCRSGVGGRLIWNRLSGDQLISTQSIQPWLGLRFYPPKSPPSLISSSPNIQHWLISAFNGWRSPCKHSACCWPPIAITLLSSHRCHQIAVILLPSSKCRCRRH